MNRVSPPSLSMDMDRLIHDFKLCHCCGLCGEVCPKGAITVESVPSQGSGLHKEPKLDESTCIHCGRCGSVCASGAISQEKFADLAAQSDRGEWEHLVFFCRKLNLARTPEPATQAAALGLPLVATRLVPQLSLVELPQGVKLVDVRCTGRIGARTLLSFLLAGVKGVLIFACPPHECEYGKDGCLAALHVEGLRSLIEAYGMDGVRVDILFEQPGSPEDVERAVRRFREGRLNLKGAAQAGRASGF